MKNLYSLVLFTLMFIMTSPAANARSCYACTPLGNQTSYGTNNVWIGYVYQGKTFATYAGWVNEGSSTSPNFDESFGGTNTSYTTNGCPVTTENFAVRYKLTKTFTSGTYIITVGGDDGYRFSLDGGSTWTINNWNDHSYASTPDTITLNGTYNMVLEYYENAGDNRVSFNVIQVCTGTENQAVYGTGNVWNGYIYQGMNFNIYKGKVTEGAAAGPNFDENFGNTSNSNTATYNTSSCSITTYQFSARYRLTKTLTNNTYTFTIGGDDGYRFSLDGGATWVINKWNDQSYTVTSYNVALNGTYNMVLEYYDNGGADRVSFAMTSTTLPVTLISWSATNPSPDQAMLTWQASNAVNFDHYVVQRSTDGVAFQDIHTTAAGETSAGSVKYYSYTDVYPYDGTVYYRLLMVDLDGRTDYSKVISLSMHESAQSVRIFPTVVTNGLFVESSLPLSGIRFELYNMSGARLISKDWSLLEGRRQLDVNSSGTLPAGAYIARLTDGHKVIAKQVILIR
jgi:hypothetical protein